MKSSKPVTWRSFVGMLTSSVTLHSLFDAVIRFFVVDSGEVQNMEQQLCLEEAAVKHLREELHLAIQAMEGARRSKEEGRRTRKFERPIVMSASDSDPDSGTDTSAMGEEEIRLKVMHKRPVKKEGEQSKLFGGGLI